MLNMNSLVKTALEIGLEAIHHHQQFSAIWQVLGIKTLKPFLSRTPY